MIRNIHMEGSSQKIVMKGCVVNIVSGTHFVESVAELIQRDR